MLTPKRFRHTGFQNSIAHVRNRFSSRAYCSSHQVPRAALTPCGKAGTVKSLSSEDARIFCSLPTPPVHLVVLLYAALPVKPLAGSACVHLTHFGLSRRFLSNWPRKRSPHQQSNSPKICSLM